MERGARRAWRARARVGGWEAGKDEIACTNAQPNIISPLASTRHARVAFPQRWCCRALALQVVCWETDLRARALLCCAHIHATTASAACRNPAAYILRSLPAASILRSLTAPQSSACSPPLCSARSPAPPSSVPPASFFRALSPAILHSIPAAAILRSLPACVLRLLPFFSTSYDPLTSEEQVAHPSPQATTPEPPARSQRPRATTPRHHP